MLLAAGCDVFSSEPTYGGLSIEGFNYTLYNLSRFVVYDKYGNTASGGGDLMPGSGQGSLSCCYMLKGADFTVKWDVYDVDDALKNLYAPIKMIHKLLVNPKFDEHPAVQKIFSETKDRPGAFGAAMDALSAPLVEQLKSNKFEHVKIEATHG
jgi:hypothetical protein